jgi:hypothetical protein
MSFDGTWNITMQSPMGAQKLTLTAKVADGVLTGTSTAADGTTVDLANGKADGTTASWDVAVTKPMPITLSFSATLDGDAISGTVKLGAFGNSKFDGTRA